LSDYPDPILDGLQAPVSSAMMLIYTRYLDWQPAWPYRLASRQTFREWDWGEGSVGPESLTDLRRALALDPRLHALVAHGMFDLVTPYFHTALLLNQVPPGSGGDRLRLAVYPGGHMFYTNERSREAFRADAMAVYGAR
jgi:carboxypeptidase C (cathepsin A)